MWQVVGVPALAAVGRLPARKPIVMLPEPPPLPHPDRTGLVAVDGVDIAFAVFNADGGDPVLLLHGGLGSMRDWSFQVPFLAGKRSIIAIDSRGQGRSTRDRRPITYALMTSDVIGVMDALALDSAAVVGWSDGAIIGLLMAIEHPDRINRLFAFGANYNTNGLKPGIADDPILTVAAEIQRQIYESVSPTRGGFDALVEAVYAMWESEPDIDARALASIRTPTTIADGELNEAIKPEHTAELARLVPGAKLLIIPGTGDFAPWEAPETFNRALAEFVDG